MEKFKRKFHTYQTQKKKKKKKKKETVPFCLCLIISVEFSMCLAELKEERLILPPFMPTHQWAQKDHHTELTDKMEGQKSKGKLHYNTIK